MLSELQASSHASTRMVHVPWSGSGFMSKLHSWPYAEQRNLSFCCRGSGSFGRDRSRWWPSNSRCAVAGIVNFCECLTASVPSSISTASPTDQILTLVSPKHSW